MALVGVYDRYGYEIVDTETGEVLYAAGNSRRCSFVVIPLDWSSCEPIERIKQLCEETGQDMASELDADYLGIEPRERDED